jgi:branched-chain amino acid transport system permease protein
VLHDVPSKVGLDFDLSEVSSGIYGFLLVVVMLVRPQGLLPERRQRGLPGHVSGLARHPVR